MQPNPLKKYGSVAEICKAKDIEALKILVIRHLQGDFFHMSHFVGVHKFEWDENIPTACINKNKICKLNPEFVAEHANTPHKLVMLICHEVYHKILRHIDIPGGYAENVAMDAVINAMLCSVFKGGRYWAFLKDFYSAEEFPTFILRPHSKFQKMRFIDKRYYRVLYFKKNIHALDNVHHYDSNDSNVSRNWGLTYEDVLDWITRMSEGRIEAAMAGLEGGQEGIPLPGGGILIGDHTQGKITKTDIDEIEQLEEILKEATEKHRSHAAGHGNTIFDEVLAELQGKKNARLAEAFNQALQQSTVSKAVNQIKSQFPELPDRTVVPLGIGRQEILMLAAGFLPVFWQTKIPDVNKGSVHVYIDVSGSMGDWIKWCFELCVGLSDWLAEPIHLFSNKVEDITLQELRAGTVKTTGGTDFDCIVEHMVREDVKKAIIITDGYASMSDDNQHALHQQDRAIFTCFIPEQYGRTGEAHGILKDISRLYYELEEDDKIAA